MSLLTEKEKARLQLVRDKLSKSKNPYHVDPSQAEVKPINRGQLSRKSLLKNRLSKWEQTTGKHVVMRKISDNKLVSLDCLLCAKPIDILSSIPVKLRSRFGSTRLVNNPSISPVSGKSVNIDTVRDIKYPEYRTGRVCSTCKHQVDISEILPEIDNRRNEVYSDTSRLGFGYSDGRGY